MTDEEIEKIADKVVFKLMAHPNYIIDKLCREVSCC